MNRGISRYQPAATDVIDPQMHGLYDRELAIFVLGVVAARLTSGLRTGITDEMAERAATRVLTGTPDDRDPIDLRAYFTSQWSRLCDQVKSDRAINATGSPPVPQE